MKKQTKKTLPYWIVIGVLGVLAIGGYIGAAGGWDWNAIANKVADKIASQVGSPDINSEPVVGAVASPIVPSPYFQINGVRTWYASRSFTNTSASDATTTPCSIKNPANATTTLAYFGFKVAYGTSTAGTWGLSTSTTAYATTTSGISLGTFPVPANAGVNWSATTTPRYVVPGGTALAQQHPLTILPSDYVIVKAVEATGAYAFSDGTFAGREGSGFMYSGACYAVFTEP